MKKIITILVCISCIYMIVQPFRILFEGGQAISMLIPTVLIILYDMQFKNRSLIIATVYTIIVLLLRSMGVEYFESYLSQLVTMFFSICCMEHYLKTRDENFARSVLITYFGCFVFMSLISIPQFYFFPEVTRQLVFAEQEGQHIESQYYWSIAYPSMHEIPLLLIPLVALFKITSRSIISFIVILSIAILFVALMLGDATTPFLMSIVVLIILGFYNSNKPIRYNMKRLLIAGGLAAILLNKAVIIAMLSFVQPVFEGTTNFTKIEDTISQIQTGQVEESSNMGQRDLVYNISKKTFWAHPLGIEKDDKNIGKHSFIIDHFAVLGLILIIPLLVLTYQRYRFVVKSFRKLKFFFIVAYIAFLALAYAKNFFLKIDAWFIVPMFLLLLEKKFIQNDNKTGIISKNS